MRSIGLMRHDPVDIGGSLARIGQHFAQNFGQIGHGVAEHLAPLHPQLADLPVVDGPPST